MCRAAGRFPARTALLPQPRPGSNASGSHAASGGVGLDALDAVQAHLVEVDPSEIVNLFAAEADEALLAAD
ncbi:MAG: hypothetical protein WBD75_00885 [Phycisphaerae bacterium]